MFRPLECFVGLRYLRARGRNGFISFISLASMLGVAVGVAALIVVLSVMNGFENELRERLLSMTSHAALQAPAQGVADWPRVAQAASDHPRVVGSAPFISLQGMLGVGHRLQPAEIRGVLPQRESEVSRIEEFMLRGRLDDLRPGGHGIILGRMLALQLGAQPGVEITLLVPEVTDGALRPRLRRFEVVGVFEAGLHDHDSALALVHLEDAALLTGRPDRVSGVRLAMDDVFVAPRVVAEITPGLPAGLETTDWTRENATYFRAIRLEKTMMAAILLLIVAVAAFNIVASLVMVVTEKRTDVAILRTLGLPARSISRLFIVQGAVIGLVGTGLGLALGLLLATNVETLVPWMEQTFGFQIMPGDVYYVTEIPAEIRGLDVATIGVLAFVLTVLATVYPSRRAAAIAPAEVLRYE